MRLIFVEFNNEVDFFLDYVKNNNLNVSDFHVVALSMETQIYLNERDIKFYNTLEFFNNESHKNCLLKSDSLVQFMEKNLDFKNNPEEINGYKDWYIFCIRHTVNYLVWLIEIVTNTVELLQPDSIVSFEFINNNYSKPFLNNNERYSGAICKLIAEKNNINLEEIKFELKNIDSSDVDKDVVERKTGDIVAKKLDLLAKKDIVLAITAGYNLNAIFKKIKKWDKKKKIVYFHDDISFTQKMKHRIGTGFNIFVNKNEIGEKLLYPNIKKDLTDCYKTLDKNKSQFRYKDIEFFDLVKNKILNGINKDVEVLVKKSNKLSYLIQKLKPNLTLSYHCRNLAYNMGEICRNNRLEALCVSHGTVVPPNNEIEEIVNRNIGKSVILNKYPSIAAQTPWCEKFLNHYQHESKDIFTGPLLFSDNIQKKKSSNDKIIVHAVTLKSRANLKFWGVETHDEFVSSITSLIEAVEKMKNVKLIIRLHPLYSHILSEERFKRIFPSPDCYSFNCGGSFYDVLASTDLLVSFSSTTIEQATINKIPVLLYDKWNRYKHFDAVELDKDKFKPYPVYYAKDEETMKKNLPLIMKEGLEDKIKEKDWDNYIYPGHYKLNFYKYLEKCFNK